APRRYRRAVAGRNGEYGACAGRLRRDAQRFGQVQHLVRRERHLRRLGGSSQGSRPLLQGTGAGRNGHTATKTRAGEHPDQDGRMGDAWAWWRPPATPPLLAGWSLGLGHPPALQARTEMRGAFLYWWPDRGRPERNSAAPRGHAGPNHHRAGEYRPRGFAHRRGGNE